MCVVTVLRSRVTYVSRQRVISWLPGVAALQLLNRALVSTLALVWPPAIAPVSVTWRDWKRLGRAERDRRSVFNERTWTRDQAPRNLRANEEGTWSTSGTSCVVGLTMRRYCLRRCPHSTWRYVIVEPEA